MSVAIVSDSTGYLTPELSPPGLAVVPVAIRLSPVTMRHCEA